MEGDFTLYVCPTVHYWDDLETLLSGARIPFRVSDASTGFLSVYASVDDFEKDHPDSKPWRMTVRRKERGDQ